MGFSPRSGPRFATTNYLAKDFETSHFPEPTSVWLKTSLSPLRSPRLGRGDFSLPSTMPPKGKKTSTFDPAVPPFDGQASFSLPVPSGSDSPFSGASTPTETTLPTKRQSSDTSASYLAGFESWRGDARDYWLHPWKLLTPKEGNPPGPNHLSVIFCTMLGDMQEDYTQKVDSLVALLTTEREARLATEDAILQLQSRLTTERESSAQHLRPSPHHHRHHQP